MWARSAYIWLSVALRTAIAIEGGAESFARFERAGHRIDLGERIAGFGEKGFFVGT
jgi:hypothetical protein